MWRNGSSNRPGARNGPTTPNMPKENANYRAPPVNTKLHGCNLCMAKTIATMRFTMAAGCTAWPIKHTTMLKPNWAAIPASLIRGRHPLNGAPMKLNNPTAVHCTNEPKSGWFCTRTKRCLQIIVGIEFLSSKLLHSMPSVAVIIATPSAANACCTLLHAVDATTIDRARSFFQFKHYTLKSTAQPPQCGIVVVLSWGPWRGSQNRFKCSFDCVRASCETCLSVHF